VLKALLNISQTTNLACCQWEIKPVRPQPANDLSTSSISVLRLIPN